MTHLILIKHSLPEVVPGVAPQEWRLNEDGRQRCTLLAERLLIFRPAVIVASVEPKASETAELVATRLGIPWEEVQGLHEHERSAQGFLERSAFEAAVAKLFAEPDQIVFGHESGSQARKRFSTAVTEALARYPDQVVAIVAHGTVISLFVEQYADIDPFALWKRLDLPSFVVLDCGHRRLEMVVETVVEA